MLVSTSCRGGRPLRDKIGMAEQLEYDTDE